MLGVRHLGYFVLSLIKTCLYGASTVYFVTACTWGSYHESDVSPVSSGAKAELQKTQQRELRKVTIPELEEQLMAVDDAALESTLRAGDAATPILLKWGKADNPDQRALAMECLALVRNEPAIQGLIDGLGDPEPDVWNMALNGLHHNNSPAAVPGLIALLDEKGETGEFACEIAYLLGKMNATDSVDLIRQRMAEETDQECHRRFELALARLEGGVELAALTQRLSHAEAAIRYQAVEEAQYVSNPALIHQLKPLLNDLEEVNNVGLQDWPVWHRVCDRVIDAIPALTGRALPFPQGGRNYTDDERQQVIKLLEMLTR